MPFLLARAKHSELSENIRVTKKFNGEQAIQNMEYGTINTVRSSFYKENNSMTNHYRTPAPSNKGV